MNNNEVSVSINEHLSALLDDEAGSFEERRVLDELKADHEFSQKLSTYALIGETMRTGESENPILSLNMSFLDNIHKEIDLDDSFDDVVVETATGGNTSQIVQPEGSDAKVTYLSWLRPIGGFSIAASFGALAFMGLQNMGVLTTPSSQPTGISDVSSPTAIAGSIIDLTPKENLVIANDDKYIDADVQTRLMLKRYVESHMQYTSSAFVPSVRAIAYTDNQ